ncbi:carbon-nitrogen hydrolase family protein [Pareuzebyella sediminis]|uniref:carbon-nitrogen hydrolase family protein n=1 Tax=Pareuzebyella sediminis TaxID=2607998 RepID=UPI0011EFAC20|nr:carbon-nitrogen hydrolase family protein [Pareuzebyella sediminis]
MRICIAQIKPQQGDIQKNIELHRKWIESAVSEQADFICFPELSLTGYEPTLARQLATDQNDTRLEILQQISQQKNIDIAVGLPIKRASKIYIGMVIFHANRPKETYLKQRLHADELPFFMAGKEQLLLSINDTLIAPAICYESLLFEHAENAKNLGAQMYLASVAKSEKGIKKAYSHFPKVAAKHSLPILMSNCVGACDNFTSAGQSAIWGAEGSLKKSLGTHTEGILIFDTQTSAAFKKEKGFKL